MAAFRSLTRAALELPVRPQLCVRRPTPLGLHGLAPGHLANGGRGCPFPPPPGGGALGPRRHYTPLTPEEEEAEKQRVAGLSAFAKDEELRKLNRRIAKLEVLRGINTGDRYTWSGRYRQLSRDYGAPLMVYYFACWGLSGAALYGLLQVAGVDAMAWIAAIDGYTGWDLAARVDPQMGKIGLTLVLNEVIEPVRLPIVILTVKPVVDRLFPPKF